MLSAYIFKKSSKFLRLLPDNGLFPFTILILISTIIPFTI